MSLGAILLYLKLIVQVTVATASQAHGTHRASGRHGKAAGQPITRPIILSKLGPIGDRLLGPK